MADPILKAQNLHVQFGGVTAADDVSIEVYAGEFVAIIGANGSGKTTFLNLCTGYVRPLSGAVYLDGRAITNKKPRSITRLGMARTFQIPQLFSEQTLVDNIMLAIAARRGIWDAFRPLNRPQYREQAEQVIDLMGLESSARQPATELPEGVRKLADIAVALALEPRVLLLDEPTSGVSAGERFSLMETLVPALRARRVTALFVEHDMDIVRRYAERVCVWDAGRVVAQGGSKEVLNDPRVLKNVVGVA